MLVQPFISTVPGSLDSKGRVCIPATYRHLLSAQNTTGVYVCPSFIDPALDSFGQELLDRINARLAGQDPLCRQGAEIPGLGCRPLCAHRSGSFGAGEGEDGTRPPWGGLMSHLPV